MSSCRERGPESRGSTRWPTARAARAGCPADRGITHATRTDRSTEPMADAIRTHPRDPRPLFAEQQSHGKAHRPASAARARSTAAVAASTRVARSVTSVRISGASARRIASLTDGKITVA